jgi:hypothetical protein
MEALVDAALIHWWGMEPWKTQYSCVKQATITNKVKRWLDLGCWPPLSDCHLPDTAFGCAPLPTVEDRPPLLTELLADPDLGGSYWASMNNSVQILAKFKVITPAWSQLVQD